MATSTAPATLTLPASLSIRGMSAVHETLLTALSKHNALALDIAEDADADLSFIQVVEAARIYAQSQGKNISLAKPANENIINTLRRGGFLTNMEDASRVFWLHGKDIQ
jgi:hypothetical protein